MTASLPCPVCDCVAATGTAMHVVVGALLDHDLDRAIDAGLLTSQPCAHCSAGCVAAFTAARAVRLRALAARDRYVARNARLERLAAERAEKRSPGPLSTGLSPSASPSSPCSHPPAIAARPPLPTAAAAALARAKARAAQRGSP